MKFLQLAPGEDPDALFRDRGVAAYDELRKHALDGITFACRALLPDPGRASAREREEALKQLFEIIAQSSSEDAIDTYLKPIQAVFGLRGRDQEGFRADFEKFRRDPKSAISAFQVVDRAAPDSGASETYRPGGPEEHLLLVCLHHEEFGPGLAGALQHDWITDSSPPGRLLNRALAAFEHQDWPGKTEVLSLAETQEEKELLTKLLFVPPREDDPAKLANEGITEICRRFVRKRLDQIELEIASIRPDSEGEFSSFQRKKAELIRLFKNPPHLAALH